MRPPRALSDLSQVLWNEREALETVLFKLEAQRLLLVDGQHRWAGPANHELDAALDELGAMELNRAVATAAAASEVGVGINAGLRELAAGSSPPWPMVIEWHIVAIVRLTEEIFEAAARNRVLLDTGLTEVQKALAAPAPAALTRLLVQSAALHVAIATNDRLLQPSLLDAMRT